jgi:hypothetical protein
LQNVVSYEKVFAMHTDDDPYYAIDLLSDKGKEKGPIVPNENGWENARKMADFFLDILLI